VSVRTSLVIVTDGRADAVLKTIESLQWLDDALFEVTVVCGPTPDGTRERVAAWAPRIKIVHCDVRNISTARNLGAAESAGEILAYIDDDAIPEPEWLARIVAAYEDSSVGAVGGIVYDYTGCSLQYDFASADRMGRADLSWQRACPELNFPFSYSFPHILGANSSFRRRALVAAGGFDAAAVAAMQAPITQEMARLETAALTLGHRLFADEPETLARRWQGWWSAWKGQ